MPIFIAIFEQAIFNQICPGNKRALVGVLMWTKKTMPII